MHSGVLSFFLIPVAFRKRLIWKNSTGKGEASAAVQGIGISVLSEGII